MLGLWTGTAANAAVKTSTFISVALGVLLLIAAAVPFFLLRRTGGGLRSTLAYLGGSVAAFATMVALLTYLEGVEKVPPVISGGLFKGMGPVLLGPILGLLAARAARGKAKLH